MNRNIILKAIVEILDELFENDSNVNENGVYAGDLIFQLECFIDSDLGENNE